MQNIPPIILYLPIATELCVFICHDFAKDCGEKSNTLVTNQQVVRRKIHLNQLSGEFGVHMSYSLKLKNMCDCFVKKVAFEHRATIIFFYRALLK